MAQTVCMAGISGVKLEGLAAQGAVNSRVLNGTASSVCVRSGRMNVVALSSQDETSSRRSLLGLIATSVAAGVFVSDAHAVSTIKLNPPPPPSGGLGAHRLSLPPFLWCRCIFELMTFIPGVSLGSRKCCQSVPPLLLSLSIARGSVLDMVFSVVFNFRAFLQAEPRMPIRLGTPIFP